MSGRNVGWLALAWLGVVGCSGYHQQADLVLADSPAAARDGSPALAEDPAPFQTVVRVGPGRMEVPVALTWTVGHDATGCARVQHVTARRAGGSEGVEITARAMTEPGGCVSLLNGPPARFDTADVRLDWRARRGIKLFTSTGHRVQLHGDGRAEGGDDVLP
jgi:hypothetical protein